jgi:hypothetical protein
MRYAHKKGEVVGPAGGETGGPHCLAEVYKLLKTALYSIKHPEKIIFPEKSVKRKIKEQRKKSKGLISTLCTTSTTC